MCFQEDYEYYKKLDFFIETNKNAEALNNRRKVQNDPLDTNRKSTTDTAFKIGNLKRPQLVVEQPHKRAMDVVGNYLYNVHTHTPTHAHTHTYKYCIDIWWIGTSPQI